VRRTHLLAVGSGVVLLPSILGFAALRNGGGPRVPTHLVEKGPFRNEVLAYGLLYAVRSTPVTVPADLQRPMRIAWLLPAGPVQKGDTVIEFDPTDIEKQALDGRSDRDSAQNKMQKALVEGGQSGKLLVVDRGLVEEELRRAEDVAPSDEQIFSRNQILESRLDRGLLEKRLRTTEAKKLPTERLAAADLALAEIEKKKAELRVRQAEQSLKSLKVEAPHDGILVYSLLWRGEAVAVGDTVWPGQPIAELPDLNAMEARVYVLEGDGGGLAVGQKAVVEVEGQPGLSYEAKIARVDAVAKTRDRQSPVKYFETALRFDADKTPGLKPGQRVRASILIDDLKDVVAIPRGALFEREGRRLAYRWSGSRFEPVEVVVGRRSLARVLVDKGLAPGDRVALHDPDRREQKAAGASPGALGPAPAAPR
jgi:RND family efflux transporter MFP subunit